MKYIKNKYKLFESEINDIIEKCKKYKIRKYEIDDGGLITVYGDVIMRGLSLEKLPFNFKEIWGDFDISYSCIKTFKGCPQIVHGDFDFDSINIENLKYCPQEIYGNFWGGENELLGHFIEFPKYIESGVCFYYCNLKSLYGIIDKIFGDFYINNNKSLKSLRYGPKHVGGSYDCSDCGLTSLYGAPKYVGENFDCSCNNIISLKYSPKRIGGDFEFIKNNIYTLEYFPEYVGGKIYCNDSPIYNIWRLFEDKNYIGYFNQMKIIKNNTVNIKKLNLFLKSIGKEPVESVYGYVNT